MWLNEEIEQSNTEENIKEKTKRIIEEADIILQKIKDFWDDEWYERALNEYREIKDEISRSIESTQQITFEELAYIKAELWDLKILDNINDLINNWVNSSEIRNKIDDLLAGHDIDFSDLEWLNKDEIKEELLDNWVPENKVNIILKLIENIENIDSLNNRTISEAEVILKQIEGREWKNSDLYLLALEEFNEIKNEVINGKSKYILAELIDLKDLNEISLAISNWDNTNKIKNILDNMLSWYDMDFSDLEWLNKDEIKKELLDNWVPENKVNVILQLIEKIGNIDSLNNKILIEAKLLLKQIEGREWKDSDLYLLALEEFNEIKNEVINGESKYILAELLDLKDLNEISLIINNWNNTTMIAIKIDHLLASSGTTIDFSDFVWLSEEEIIEELSNLTESKKNLILLLLKKIEFIKNSKKILESIIKVDQKKFNSDISKLKYKKESDISFNLDLEDFHKDSSWNLRVDNPIWGWSIETTLQEMSIILGNPDAFRNFINFYEFFRELNLEWVWKYRKELVNSIWDIHINLEDYSLRDSELLSFWNKLINIINNIWNENKNNEDNTKLKRQNTLAWLKNELRIFSEAWNIINSAKTFNNLWEDKFTNFLRKHWIIWWAYFCTYKLREASI